MDYLFRYAIKAAPQSRNDGSGQVANDMSIKTLPDDGSSYDTEDWRSAPDAPGHHKTVVIPGAELSAALASGTVGEKVAAYKALIVAYHNAQAEPMDTGWVLNKMEEFMDNNDISAAAAVAADTFIKSVDPGAYPVTFTL